MKYLIYTISIVLALSTVNTFAQCNDELMGLASNHLGDALYQKDYKVKMKKAKKNKPPTVQKFTIILNKGMQYRFIVENAREYAGQLTYELSNIDGKILSNYNRNKGQHYEVIDFVAKRTGMHYMHVWFNEGKEGCGILMVGYKQPKSAYEKYYGR